MSFDYSKLRGRIVEKYGTQTNFINHLAMSGASFYHKLNNRQHFDNVEILEMQKLLEIPDNEIQVYFFTEKVK